VLAGFMNLNGVDERNADLTDCVGVISLVNIVHYRTGFRRDNTNAAIDEKEILIDEIRIRTELARDDENMYFEQIA
jgi:hypothetical protein